MLTGKCLSDFYIWLDKQDVAPYKAMFWDIPKMVQHSYLTWFFINNQITFSTDYDKTTNQYFGKVLDLTNNLRTDVSKNIKEHSAFIDSIIESADFLYNKRKNL